MSELSLLPRKVKDSPLADLTTAAACWCGHRMDVDCCLFGKNHPFSCVLPVGQGVAPFVRLGLPPHFFCHHEQTHRFTDFTISLPSSNGTL